ncbi:DUF572-domain-containing protein [Plenodomus tracheiphilus IPT5]|uniref:DUF572-domain-containing protein n=1 Tax=Plenodomus tracheiphilus IPT5 TaxID=1408161 RepID=A0A6A7AZC0_9PLEO|nr:DUF572-domain-containing protein [Plenodomus tracheiphilus IPT5]
MQGFNMGRYYPPDASNPPTFNTTHPLGARANKSAQGILTVRFELPFAVWCQHCKPEAIVGQGVRFNAEKKRVGNYYSTPIWSFRMKHTACGGWWEIRTDPSKSEYIVHEGARRRDYGTVEEGEGELKMLSTEERERRREDAFAGLEGKVEQKALDKGNKERVEELYERSGVWRDPYDVNARLRKEFRGRRKVWKREERYKEGMQEKFSLGLDIVDETEGDRVRAKMVEFGGAADVGGEGMWKPLFEDKEVGDMDGSKTKKLKSEIAAEKSRQSLQKTLVGNTRAVVDPFLAKGNSAPPRVSLGLLKRKRDSEAENSTKTQTSVSKKVEDATVAEKNSVSTLALVDYDSD